MIRILGRMLLICTSLYSFLGAEMCPMPIQGPTGSTGATGPTGPTGPTGMLPSDFIYAYSESLTNITLNDDPQGISFDTIDSSSGITITSDTDLIVSTSGYYLIGWNFTITNLNAGDTGRLDVLTALYDVNGDFLIPSGSFESSVLSSQLLAFRQPISGHTLVYLNAGQPIRVLIVAFANEYAYAPVTLFNPSVFMVKVSD